MDAIRCARLELIPLSGAFVEAVKCADLPAAEDAIGAAVSPWLVANSAPLVQLQLAQVAGEAAGVAPLGRVIVIAGQAGRRTAIGSIGFHGPPDDRGRLEAACAIDPAYRDEGYAAEAMSALVEWASERFGITRYVFAVTAPLRGPTKPLDGARSIVAWDPGHAGSAATRNLRSSATTGATRNETSQPGAQLACDRPRRS